MRNRARNWMLRRVVLGFAVLAVAAPTAQARVDEGIKGQPNSTGELGVTPSTASGLPHVGLNDYLRLRDGIEFVRLQPRSTVRSLDLIEKVRVAPRVSTPQVVSSPGFNWRDAGIGAALAFGAILLAGAAYLGTRRLGSPQTA